MFTRAAIVPRVDSVFHAGSTASPAPLDPGSNTLHITGKGFGPDVVMGVGNGVTVTVLSHTASQITAEVVVANSAETGPRDVFVSNLGLPISGLSSLGAVLEVRHGPTVRFSFGGSDIPDVQNIEVGLDKGDNVPALANRAAVGVVWSLPARFRSRGVPMSVTVDAYPLGRSDAETRRLILQHQI